MKNSDVFPEGWMPMPAYPPEPCESYDVRLADDSACRAFWTGKVWWYQGKVITPVCWRIPEAAAA